MDDVTRCCRAYEKCRALLEAQVAEGRLHPVFASRWQLGGVVSDLGLATLSDVQVKIVTALEQVRAEGTKELHRAHLEGEAVHKLRSHIDAITPENETWLTPLIGYEIAHRKLGTEISITAAELMGINMAIVRELVLRLPQSLTQLYESRDPSIWAEQLIGLAKAASSAFAGDIVGFIEAFFEPIRKKARQLIDASDELTSMDKYITAVWAWCVIAEGIGSICEKIALASAGAVSAQLSPATIRSNAESNVHRRFRELCAGTWTQQ